MDFEPIFCGLTAVGPASLNSKFHAFSKAEKFLQMVNWLKARRDQTTSNMYKPTEVFFEIEETQYISYL